MLLNVASAWASGFLSRRSTPAACLKESESPFMMPEISLACKVWVHGSLLLKPHRFFSHIFTKTRWNASNILLFGGWKMMCFCWFWHLDQLIDEHNKTIKRVIQISADRMLNVLLWWFCFCLSEPSDKRSEPFFFCFWLNQLNFSETEQLGVHQIQHPDVLIRVSSSGDSGSIWDWDVFKDALQSCSGALWLLLNADAPIIR